MKTYLFILFTVFNLAAFAQDTSMVQAEYFFDSANGVGKNTLVNVTPATDGTFPFTASIAGLSVGYHKLYIRTKDSNGKWSFTARRNVEVFSPEAKTTIVSGEYFIDVDPGYGAAIPIAMVNPDSAILQSFSAATSGLSAGYHKLYGRFKDNLGRWSSTFRRNIDVYKNDTSYVYNAEYYFKTDNGYGNCTEVKLTNPSVDGKFSFTIPFSQIPAGADTLLFIRVQDSTAGKWSFNAIKNIPVPVPLTLLSFNVVKQNNTAQLAWQTTNEINTAYFNVQRSTDGRSFNTVGKVTAKNSGGNNDYVFTNDISQLSASKIYYRLEMADIDEKLNYSIVKYIDINGMLKIVVAPNPVTGNNFILHIFSPNSAKMQLMIYNNLSKLIYSEQFGMQKGNLNKPVNLSSLAAGSYLVMITDGTSVRTVKFIKQ